MDFITLIASIKDDYEVDLARLLVLIKIFSGRKSKPFKGLTKLAKLDFLLRYPIYLEKSLQKIGTDPSKVKTTPIERNTIESKMIRYKYGPWDPKHRSIVNLMISRGLAKKQSGKYPIIVLTNEGRKVAEKLQESPEFSDISNRSSLLYQHFNRSGKWLKNFIYETFPEIVDYRMGDEITYD